MPKTLKRQKKLKKTSKKIISRKNKVKKTLRKKGGTKRKYDDDNIDLEKLDREIDEMERKKQARRKYQMDEAFKKDPIIKDKYTEDILDKITNKY